MRTTDEMAAIARSIRDHRSGKKWPQDHLCEYWTRELLWTCPLPNPPSSRTGRGIGSTWALSLIKAHDVLPPPQMCEMQIAARAANNGSTPTLAAPAIGSVPGRRRLPEGELLCRYCWAAQCDRHRVHCSGRE